MLKIITALLTVLFLTNAQGQKVNGKLNFQQGQKLDIAMDVKTKISQEAMGQAIDFNVDGTAFHSYQVTNATKDNNTLRHQARRIKFNFEGMGQSRPFDSDDEKDMKGPLGKPIQETLKQTFDMVIDPSGKVLMVQPEKIAPAEMDERMKLITSMLKDILDVVQPPQKNANSFFKILPDKEVGKMDTWTDSMETSEGKFNNVYTVSDITDSTIIVDLQGTSTTTSKLEIMTGMEIITTLNNKTTGKMILDRSSGIVKQKSFNTESHGTTQGMGGETPITSKTAINIIVSPNK